MAFFFFFASVRIISFGMVTDMLKCHIWHVHMSILTAVTYEIPDNKGKYCRWNENSHFLLWKRKKSEFSNKLWVGFLLYHFFVLQFQRSSLLLFFWSCSTAFGILVPWPGNESLPPAVEALSLTTGPPGKSPGHLFQDLLHWYYLVFWTEVTCRALQCFSFLEVSSWGGLDTLCSSWQKKSFPDL